MSEAPRIVLSTADIDFLVDECAHLDRGAIAGGLTAHRWLSMRHEQENQGRALANQPRIDFPAFLGAFINDLGPASRAQVERLGLDPRRLPEGVTLSPADRDALRDVLALDVIEGALWQRSAARPAQLAETEARAQALVDRHRQRFPDGEEHPPLPGTSRGVVTSAAPMPDDPTAWMLRYAAAHLGRTGEKLARDAGIAACVAGLKCSERAAGAAYAALPEALKVGQGRPLTRSL